MRLWKRLGSENRGFLIAVADEYTPDAEFSLADMAKAAKISKPSAWGRLMNIGRSIKSLRIDPETLWSITWEGDENSYTWKPAARDAILRLAGR